MRSRFLVLLSLFLIGAFALQLRADTLRLRDGRVIPGTFLGANRSNVQFQPDRGGRRNYGVGEIDSISFGSYGSPNNSGYGYPNSPNYNGGADRYRDNPDPYRDNADRSRNVERPYNDARPASDYVLPAGSEIAVRMIDSINSDATHAGELYRATLDQPIVVNGRVIAPAGSEASVQVVRVDQGGRISGREEVTLTLESFTANGRRYVMNSGQEEVASGSRGKQSAEVIGGGAALGAIIGAIAGGGKGAAIGAGAGAAIGTGAQVLRGQNVKVPSESRLTFTLTRDLNL